jgi:hypothetical protein
LNLKKIKIKKKMKNNKINLKNQKEQDISWIITEEMEGVIKTRSYKKMMILTLLCFIGVTLFCLFLQESGEALSEMEEKREREFIKSNEGCDGYFNRDCIKKLSQRLKDQWYAENVAGY